MVGKRFVSAAVLLIACLVLAVGCAPRDPAEEILQVRRAWKVDLVSFIEREDRSVSAQFRLSGPAYNDLTELTVFLELLDEGGNVVGASWPVFDLSDAPRGGPVEKYLIVPGPTGGQAVESIRLDLVPVPGPDQVAHIRELQGL